MIERKLKINNKLEDSIFLFGARQTGKSTFLREKFPDSIYIDLLDTSVASRFKRTPSLLYDTLIDKPQGTLVIIDEIPEVPEMLNEVHRLMSEKGKRLHEDVLRISKKPLRGDLAVFLPFDLTQWLPP